MFVPFVGSDFMPFVARAAARTQTTRANCRAATAYNRPPRSQRAGKVITHKDGRAFPHPWVNLFVPAVNAEKLIGGTLATLTIDDVGQGIF